MYSYVQLWTLVGSSCRTDQVTGLVEVYIVLCTSVDIGRVKLEDRSGHCLGRSLCTNYVHRWTLVWSSCRTDQVTGLVEVCVQLCTSLDIGRVKL